MGQLDVDASNSCIPPQCPLDALYPPLPTTVRGEPCVLDGKCGRINSDRPVLLYGSGRLVVVRELGSEIKNNDGGSDERIKAFVYRGHTAQVTCAKFSPSGCYVASADIRGKLRVWSYDNDEHLCKLDLSAALAGPIRGISWDMDSKRICIVGEGSKIDSSSNCARVIQWDTGVTCGELAQHTRNRAMSCTFKPNRPMRIVTGGGDDSRCLFNKGPPFERVVDGKVAEQCHIRGAVNCVRYSNDGTKIASVGTDKSVCFYDGKTMELINKMDDVHNATIYACAWSSDDKFLLTCSADGTVKLVNVKDGKVAHTWDVAGDQQRGNGSPGNSKAPIGGMQMGCAFVQNDVPISVGLNGQIAVLPVPSGLLASGGGDIPDMKFLTGHQSPIAALTIDHDSGTMFTGDTDGIICKWDIQSGRAMGRLLKEDEDSPSLTDKALSNKIHGGAITSMTCVNGSVMSIGWDDMIRISDRKDDIMNKHIKILAQPNSIMRGTNLAVVLTVHGLLLMKDNQIVSDFIKVPYEALSGCVSSDDTMVCVGGEDCSIHIYTVVRSSLSYTLEEVHTLKNGHLKPIHAVALSNDGTKLASADVRDVCVWSVPSSSDENKGTNASDWAPLIGKSRWCFHTQRITCLAWSNDDGVLASGGNDDSIYLWSLAKKTKRVHYPFAHRGGVTGLEFLKRTDRVVLVSAGADGCVNQWDVTTDVSKKFG